MMRVRAGIAGLVGTLMLFSAAAHGFMGWPAIAAELARTTAPPDLVSGLAIGWWFGSVCMLAFAVIVWSWGVSLWRGGPAPRLPVLTIGIAYLAFGVAAIALSGVSPPMVSFVVLGAALVALSAWRGKGAA